VYLPLVMRAWGGPGLARKVQAAVQGSGGTPTTHRLITYTYDSLYRLTAADYSTGEFYRYAYDAVGNRLQFTDHVSRITHYEYDAANRLTSVNGVVYTWDANGNLLSDGLRSYSYDHANRLVQVVSGTLTTDFAYNGAGDRVARTVDGVTTDYVLDPAAGLTQVLQETTAGQTTSYLYGADLLAQSDSGTWAYHVNDGLGSVRQLTDAAGQVVASYRFDPFGVPLGESGGEPYGFTGEQWDAEVELLYLRARYYSPEVGRFISRDPVLGYMHAPRSQHPYAYAWNNPVRLTDPSGQQVSDELRDIVNKIVGRDENGRVRGGVDALIKLFETDELEPYDPPASNSAQARLELVLEVTNRRLPFGLDAGIHFEIDFSTCGLQERFNDEWLYRKYWNQNPDDLDTANQVGHFLTAVRLGYDPTFLVPLLALEANLSVSVPQVRPLLPMDESIEVTAKRLIVGHEKKGDPAPTGSQARDALLTLRTIPLQYWAAEPEDVDYFDLAVAADRDWRTDLRDYYLGKILGATTTEDLPDLRERQGNSMEDLRLSVKGWRLGRAVAGLDGNAQPTEKQLTTRLEVASWLRMHIAMPGLP